MTARPASIPHEVVDLVVSHDMTAARAWREHLNLPLDRVAARLGMEPEAYAALEQSESGDHHSLERVAAALGITFEQLDF